MSEPILRRSSRNATKKDVAPAQAPATEPVKKRTTAEPKKPAVKKAKVVAEKGAATAKAVVAKPAAAGSSKTAAKEKKPAVANGGLSDGDVLPADLPELQTHDGTKTTISALLEGSDKGIILFAYSKAATPGCTTQACLFRDNLDLFRGVGYTVVGLSGDQPASNDKFKTKQNLTYTLLSDPSYDLHEKLGIKKAPKGTLRSVIVIEKSSGKILKKGSAGPSATLQIAKEALGLGEKKTEFFIVTTGSESAAA